MASGQVQDAPVESAEEAAGRGRLLAPGLLALILLLGFSTAMAIATDRARQRRFDITGAGFPMPSLTTAAAAGRPTAPPVRKSKRKTATTSAEVVISSTSTPSPTGDENSGTGTTTTGTPRQGTRPASLRRPGRPTRQRGLMTLCIKASNH